MARYEIAVPDGARYEVTAPDSMPQADVLARFQRELPSQQQPQSWGEYARGLGREALQGATFDFGDELGLTDRAASERFGAQYPIASTVARIAGGVAPFVAGPGAAVARLAVGSTLPRTIARSAGVGAGLGAVSGAGAGEGGLAERLPGAATGAAFGAAAGAALPPVIAGAGSLIGSARDMFQRAGGRASAGYEPPVPPVGRRSVEGARFVGDGATPELPAPPPTPGDLSASEGGLRLINDWITSAGGSIEGLENAWAAAQQSTRFHGSGRALNAQTLAEIYPPLQRLLRAAASSYREVGEDVTRFLQARQTGILPPGASARDLAQRGIPTRERFQPGRTVRENFDEFGVVLGTGEKNVSPTGALGRIVDATKRLFRIKDTKFHGHAATAGKTSDEILAAMRADSNPAYTKAFATGDMVSVRPALDTIEQRWTAEAAQYGRDYRRMVTQALDRFRDDDGNLVARLRAFDKAKQKLDSDIGEHLRAGRDFEARELTKLKNEMLAAVDGITDGNLGTLYSGARGIYARGARDRDTLEQFKAAWKDDPDEVLKRYDALVTDDDRKLARLGIVWGMEAEAAGKRAAQDVTLAFDVNRAERMLTLLGRRMRAGEDDAEDVMRRFGDYIAGEQEMVRGTAKTAIGGSMTDRNLQDAMAMGNMEIIQNVQSLKDVFSGSTSMWQAGQRFFEWASNRAFGMSADRAREATRMLLTANQKEIPAIIARLRMIAPANRIARFNDLLKQAQSTAAGSASGLGGMGGAAGAPMPVSGSGPVSF